MDADALCQSYTHPLQGSAAPFPPPLSFSLPHSLYFYLFFSLSLSLSLPLSLSRFLSLLTDINEERQDPVRFVSVRKPRERGQNNNLLTKRVRIYEVRWSNTLKRYIKSNKNATKNINDKEFEQRIRPFFLLLIHSGHEGRGDSDPRRDCRVCRRRSLHAEIEGRIRIDCN
jgi:hypothetical protein